ANTFESFVAALYLQFGIDAARRFVVEQHVANVDLDPHALLDPKTRLQQYAQAHAIGLPTYNDDNDGTAQRPTFTSTVYVDGRNVGSGQGSSKKAAQQAAAIAALASLEGTPTGQGIS
ncbi:MAG TPA: putative dsRNA-binding protein, partial [Candidatus Dormibacteraeota bacterium]|nr:putative dsRNA-binding protein [Candidatus Dormibacteraeota bacterium]